MKTLVIHPYDPTTDKLELVYKNHPEFTVCRDNGISKKDLYKLIEEHDRIIMMGHGLPQGLINSDRNDFLVDSSFYDLLETKDTCSIWCYSYDFFKERNLKGFHTGMIISEVAEEKFVLGKAYLNEQEMLKNFELFSKCLGECIEYSAEDMQKYMLDNYIGSDPITEFNRSNIKLI